MEWSLVRTTAVLKGCGELSDYAAVTAQGLNSPHVSSSVVSRGSKRKSCISGDPNDLKEGSSLVLSLGPSLSSCTSMCSEEKIEEDSPADLGLNINLNYRSPNPKKALAVTSSVTKEKWPELDLQLSLSTGPTESDVTSVTTQGFIPCQNHSELPVSDPAVNLVDEGSTSSRWKAGLRVPPCTSLLKFSIQSVRRECCANPNPVVQNNSSAPVLTPSLDSSPSGAVNKLKRKTSVKPCQFEGCTRGARGASGLCITHGGGRRCQKDGCQKGAEGKTIFCKAHGGGRRCQHLGCTRSAEGRTDFCISHGGGRRCSHEGCTRAARGKSGLCIRHGGGKRCKVENCIRSAEGITGLCISHGGGRRCQYPGCAKGAQGSTIFCKGHGGGRRCTFTGCTKGAEGSTPFCKGHGGGKRCTAEGCPKSVHGGTLFCVSHGGGKRCAMPECTKSARGRTDYCVRHGGGKRCKAEGCPRSAQGSTDFCKSHGGGKRCSWGHPGSDHGSQGGIPCDKFARGKSGLCAAHLAQVQGKQIQKTSMPKDPNPFTSARIFAPGTSFGTESFGCMGYRHESTAMSMPSMGQENFVVENRCLGDLSLPEGRVHGGGLMAMLRGAIGTSNDKTEEGSAQSELDKIIHMSHRWV